MNSSVLTQAARVAALVPLAATASPAVLLLPAVIYLLSRREVRLWLHIS